MPAATEGAACLSESLLKQRHRPCRMFNRSGGKFELVEGYLNPMTLTGISRFVFVPSPSWPAPFEPQHLALAPFSAQV